MRAQVQECCSSYSMVQSLPWALTHRVSTHTPTILHNSQYIGSGQQLFSSNCLAAIVCVTCTRSWLLSVLMQVFIQCTPADRICLLLPADNPVTDDTIKEWSGFVSMIVDGYFNRRMAWFPIDRLQMELLAVQGLAAAPHDVAEWARIVYTVLEKVHPQFPSE